VYLQSELVVVDKLVLNHLCLALTVRRYPIGNDLERTSVVQSISEAVEDKTGSVPVIAFSRTLWVKFTPTLNAAMAYAIEHDYPLILFQV
jgi:hypothetical protein